jgi:hypothetical protein
MENEGFLKLKYKYKHKYVFIKTNNQVGLGRICFCFCDPFMINLSKQSTNAKKRCGIPPKQQEQKVNQTHAHTHTRHQDTTPNLTNK